MKRTLREPLVFGFLLSASVALSSCVSSGNKELETISYEQVQQTLIKGQTTKSEVISRYGEPSTTTAINGEERWIYHHSEINILTINMKSFITLNIVFEGDVVADFSLNKSGNSL